MSKFYQKIKEIYEKYGVTGLIDMKQYVVKGLITEAEYEEITGTPYEPDATNEDFESALEELGL